jgi:hypothetical protein
MMFRFFTPSVGVSRFRFGLISLGLVAALVGCSSPAAPETVTPDSAAAQNQPNLIQIPTVDASREFIRAHLATTVLDVGQNRIAFLLETHKGLIKAPTADISIAHSDDTAPAARATANFNPWPYGVRGSYATAVDFPAPGRYVLTAMVSENDVQRAVEIPVDVLAETPIPSLGDPAPPSATKVLGDGLELPQLTTAYSPDAELYRLSVSDVVADDVPAVIVFATPAFCTSPTCGPQVDTVSELRAAHPDTANYVHVELYDNPAEIQGDLSKGRLVPAADEWGFTRLEDWVNESWVFVLDADGIVRHRFEGFATLNELEAALADVEAF